MFGLVMEYTHTHYLTPISGDHPAQDSGFLNCSGTFKRDGSLEINHQQQTKLKTNWATRPRIISFVCLVGVFALSGCDNAANVKPVDTAKRNSKPEQAEVTAKGENKLLEDGFYTKQQTPSTLLNLQQETTDNDPFDYTSDTLGEKPLAKGGKEPLAKGGKEPLAQGDKEPLAQGSKKPLSERDLDRSIHSKQKIDSNVSLIEELGFSNAEPAMDFIDKTSSSTERYCLSDSEREADLSPAICQRISQRLASVKLAACEAAKLRATGCTSINGFPILVREFAPIKGRIPKGRILVIGGTHGDELTSVSVSLRWIEKLNKHHSGLFHWHIAPMMNPDGVLKKAATRTNENGVDLNRNMPSTDWNENAVRYWKEKGSKDPRKFPGEKSASEPETQWLIDEINTFKPDAIISVHAPYGVVDFDSLLLNTAPKSLGKLHLNLLGTYPGSLGNYAGINRNIPVITLELPHSWVMPSETETTRIWEDIVSWLRKNISNSDASN